MKNIIIFIIILGLFACKQDPDPTEPPTGCGMTIDQFPLKVGNSWTYKMYESVDGGSPYQYYAKIKLNIIGFDVVAFQDTLFIAEHIGFDNNDDTIFYNINKEIRKSNEGIIPFNLVDFNNGNDFISFPITCNDKDTIEKFKESDTLFSVLIKGLTAIKDTNINIKNNEYITVQFLRYKQTKMIDLDYYHFTIFQWYYIAPNIGVVQIEVKGVNHYPFSANFNYLYKLIDYKIF
jgi:hypothetical protein